MRLCAMVKLDISETTPDVGGVADESIPMLTARQVRDALERTRR